MPRARSENCPSMKYIMASPNSVPKTTGRMSSGSVSQLRKQMKINASTMMKAPSSVVVRSRLMVVEL